MPPRKAARHNFRRRQEAKERKAKKRTKEASSLTAFLSEELQWDQQLPECLFTCLDGDDNMMTVIKTVLSFLDVSSFHGLLIQHHALSSSFWGADRGSMFWHFYREALAHTEDKASNKQRQQRYHSFEQYCQDLFDFASPAMLLDGYVMGRSYSTISCCGALRSLFLSRVDSSLWGQPPFIAELIRGEPWNLFSLMPHRLQEAYPETLVFAFRQLGNHVNGCYSRKRFDDDHQCQVILTPIINTCVGTISPAVWNNRQVVLGWFRAGLPYHKHFPVVYKEDKEIFLLLAQHGRLAESSKQQQQLVLDSFSYASKWLRRDKQFMMQAIALDSYVWKFTYDESLLYDEDILLLVFSCAVNTEYFLGTFLPASRHHRKRRLAQEFYTKIQRKLHRHETFVKVVLAAMTLLVPSRDEDPQCLLSTLNQDTETSHAYRKLIAEYLHVPVGREVRLLRQASRNMGNFVY